MSTTGPSSPAPLPDSWKVDETETVKRRSRSGRLIFIVGGIIVVLVVVLGLIAFMNRDDGDTGPWPDDVNGRPPGLGQEGDTTAAVTDPTAEPGVYLWSGFDGWHLWVVNGDGVAGAKGTITSNTDFASAELSAPDDGSVTVDGKEVAFDLGSDGLNGVDFNPGFAHELTFDIDGPDGPIPAERITTGQDHPVTAVPVVVTKLSSSDSGS